MDTRRAILLHLTRRPMPLSELASATGTSLPTLRRAVRELVDFDWIDVVGRAEDTGGRPAQLFGLDAGVQTVVGVHLAHPGMRVVAVDLAGAVVHRWVPEGVHDLEPETVYASVVEFMERFRASHPDRHVLGIGVATPGYVDPATGAVIAIGRVEGWSDLPVAERLRAVSGLPVTIGNDMDALATAEFGLGEGAPSYAYVGYGEGVKFTLFLDGAPYLGPFGNAGLVGPALLAGGVDADASRLLKIRGVAAAYDAELGRDPAVSTPLGPSAALEAFTAVLARAGSDPVAARVVARMAEVLAAQIAYFVHLMQPGVLVVGGALAGAPDAVLDRVEAETRRRLPPLLDSALVFRRAEVQGEDATAAGAAGAFLRRFLAEDAPALGSLVR